MEGKEISPADIKKALNTPALETYTSEITALIKSGLLTSIRNKSDAQNIARETGKKTNQITRYKVVCPQK